MSHFKGRGFLWEMWNEPNHKKFWQPPATRDDYIALARTTGEALRGAKLLDDAGEAFIGPATSEIDQSFLEACFKAGLLEFWDAVSVHPYRQKAPETVEEEYRAVRLLIRRYAPPEKVIPIISGEWGYSSAWDGYNEQRQARELPRQLLTNIANDVALSIWYDWRDAGRDPKNPEHRFGIVRHEYHAGRNPVFDRKPAWQTLTTLTTQLGGFRFNKSLASRENLGRMDRVMLFEKEDEVRVAAWSYGDTGNVVELPASRGPMTIVTSEGTRLEQKAGEAGNVFGVRYRLDPDSAYLLFPKPNDALRIAAAVTRLPLEAGESQKLSIGFTNILNYPLSARFGSPDHFLPLLVCTPADMRTQLVPPRARFEKHFATRSTIRQVDGTPLLLGIEIAPFPGTHISENIPIYQWLRVVPSLPMRVTRVPGPPEEVVVRIENPSGQVWNGSIQATVNGYKGGALRISEKVELTFAKGVSEVVVRTVLIKEKDRVRTWRANGVSLVASDGTISAFQIPDVLFIPLDVPHVEILPDGDSKGAAVPKASAEPPAAGAIAKDGPPSD